jgi:hypothetical protein
MKNKKIEKELNKINARAYVMLRNLEKVKKDIIRYSVFSSCSVSYNKCEGAIYDLIKELINISKEVE